MATAEKSMSLTQNPIIDNVAKQIAAFQEQGRLRLPPNYSAQNALYSAWLTLQTVKDKSERPALQVCTKESITNSLLDMVIQGLNPSRKQCHFIVYGNVLTCQRSYFGTMGVTKRVLKCQDILAEVVYEGDDFEYSIERGNKVITKHVQALKNVNKDKIVAAYCTIVMPDNRSFTEVMTIDEIKVAWAKSKMNPEAPGSNHKQFPQEMAKRTVINRCCKGFINSSDDSSLDLVVEAMHRSDEVIEEAEFEQEVAQNANAEVIEVEFVEKPEEDAEESEQQIGRASWRERV